MFDENPTIILSTDMVNFEDVGVSVSIPKQELDQGSQMEVFIHPCVTGSFILPDGFKLASPTYLIQLGKL